MKSALLNVAGAMLIAELGFSGLAMSPVAAGAILGGSGRVTSTISTASKCKNPKCNPKDPKSQQPGCKGPHCTAPGCCQ